MEGKSQRLREKKSEKMQFFPALAALLPDKNQKIKEKVFTFGRILCIIKQQPKYGGVPDSIAGERKDKHTVDGVTTLKHST